MDDERIYRLVLSLTAVTRGVLLGVESATRIAEQFAETISDGTTLEEIREAEDRVLTNADTAIRKADAAIAKRQAWEREQQG